MAAPRRMAQPCHPSPVRRAIVPARARRPSSPSCAACARSLPTQHAPCSLVARAHASLTAPLPPLDRSNPPCRTRSTPTRRTTPRAPVAGAHHTLRGQTMPPLAAPTPAAAAARAPPALPSAPHPLVAHAPPPPPRAAASATRAVASSASTASTCAVAASVSTPPTSASPSTREHGLARALWGAGIAPSRHTGCRITELHPLRAAPLHEATVPPVAIGIAPRVILPRIDFSIASPRSALGSGCRSRRVGSWYARLVGRKSSKSLYCICMSKSRA